jgi:hypothetical protein
VKIAIKTQCLFFRTITATRLAGIGRRPQRRQLFEMALAREATNPAHLITGLWILSMRIRDQWKMENQNLEEDLP